MSIRIHCDGITHQLLRIRDDGDDAADEALGEIDDTRSATIRLQNNALREPDTTFKHWQATYPGVVVEIANTQKGEDLPMLAHQYIVESSGSIQLVIGIKLDYRCSKKATISTWRGQNIIDRQGSRLISQEIVKSQV